MKGKGGMRNPNRKLRKVTQGLQPVTVGLEEPSLLGTVQSGWGVFPKQGPIREQFLGVKGLGLPFLRFSK